jgi:DNA-binding CsgD family transcriptional regulator
VCAAVADVAARNDVLSLGAVALRCRGLTDDDVAALEAAADAFARGPRVLDAALTTEEAGRAHCRRGDAARGRALLDDAARRFEQLDATRDLLRVEAALRAAGVRRGQRGPRVKARHGWASLTPTEHTVARLAADGLSNPQIGDQLYISHRTVQTHLSHIFTKLGISSRVQLTVEVTRRVDAGH